MTLLRLVASRAPVRLSWGQPSAMEHFLCLRGEDGDAFSSSSSEMLYRASQGASGCSGRTDNGSYSLVCSPQGSMWQGAQPCMLGGIPGLRAQYSGPMSASRSASSGLQRPRLVADVPPHWALDKHSPVSMCYQNPSLSRGCRREGGIEYLL